jgi:1-acyl-sn-glycerol-3-phosphate acyltransferase
MDASTYEHGAPLSLPAIERFPRRRGLWVSLLRSGIQLMMRGTLRIFHRLEIDGQKNLPLDRSFIMVCNHSSHLDAVCLLASLPLTRVHRAFPVAAADYFFSTPLRSVLSVIAVNGLPIDRHHGGDGLGMCREILSIPGHVLIVFPEGTRTCSGALGRFRSGVARLVAGTTTPVVPCHLSGAFEAWPKGRAVPRPLPLHLRIGHPRTFADYAPADHSAISQISAQLRHDVAALSHSSARAR